MASFISTGTTVTFGTTGFTGDILSVDPGSIAREAVDSSHLASVDWRTFLVGALTDPGELSLEVAFDPATWDTNTPANNLWLADPETITIVWSDDNPTTMVGTGFLTGFEATAPLEDKMVSTITIKFTGALDVTAAP